MCGWTSGVCWRLTCLVENILHLMIKRIELYLKLGAFFCITGFDVAFPVASSRVLPRVGSDHTPVVWDSGVDQIPRTASFNFEK